MECISTSNCQYLTASQIRVLNQVGIKTFIDFVQSSKETICSTLAVNDKEYSIIKAIVLKHCQPLPVTLVQLATPDRITPKSTGIPELDNVLRGGILPGDVIEIFGKTGSGKSWLCMQILAQYIFFHEEPSHVLYLDMKNDFDARRLNNLCGLSMTRDPDKRLKRALVIKEPNLERLVDVLDQMKNEIIGEVNVFYERCRLLIVDSVPMAIYPAVEQDVDQCWRLQQERLVEKLKWMANRLNLSIILVNHAVSVRSSNNGSASGSYSLSQSTPKPALGKYWIQKINIRIYIESQSKKHMLTVLKNCRGPEDQIVNFQLNGYTYF